MFSQLQIAVMKKVLKKYKKLSVAYALETAKQNGHSPGYSPKETLNGSRSQKNKQSVFFMAPLRAYSQWQGNTILTDLPRLETEQYEKPPT